MGQMPSKPREPKQYNSFIKYTGLALQMGITIYLGHWLGEYVDGRTGRTDMLWTKIISLLAVFLSIFSTIRQVIKDSRD